MPDGFVIFKPKHLEKVNNLRRAATDPKAREVPILSKGQVLYTTAEQMNYEPASCYNCMFQNKDETCQLHGPNIIVKKYTVGSIQFWPCCGLQQWGEPSKDEPVHLIENDPDNTGLVWINAPDVGQEYGGATCGGLNGGDDCDYYVTPGTDKRAVLGGFCRVLQTKVGGGDVCTGWQDDDQIVWRQAQVTIKRGLSNPPPGER